MKAAGVDISSVAINEILPITVRKFLYHSSLTQLPFSNGGFYSGYSFHVLEHLTKDEIEYAISEISRVVRYQLYLIIPTWDKLLNKEIFNQIVFDPTHKTIATRKWWIDQFSKKGWSQNEELEKQFDRLNRGWVFFLERS